MSSLTKVLAEEVRKIEETAAVARTMQTNRLTHHLMPPVGWLNDPNGLCWYKGRYHVFFALPLQGPWSENSFYFTSSTSEPLFTVPSASIFTSS